nr:MAG TPA: hypothetical protein [Caudoviricetes sp.]
MSYFYHKIVLNRSVPRKKSLVVFVFHSYIFAIVSCILESFGTVNT